MAEDEMTKKDQQLSRETFDLLPFNESSDVGEWTDPRINSLEDLLKFEKVLLKNGSARQQLVSL